MPAGPWPTDGAEMPAKRPSSCPGTNPGNRSPSMSARGAVPGPSEIKDANRARRSCGGSVWEERARAAMNQSRSRICSVRTSPSRREEDRADSGALDRRPARGHHRLADAEATGPGPMPLADGWSLRTGGRQAMWVSLASSPQQFGQLHEESVSRCMSYVIRPWVRRQWRVAPATVGPVSEARPPARRRPAALAPTTTSTLAPNTSVPPTTTTTARALRPPGVGILGSKGGWSRRNDPPVSF